MFWVIFGGDIVNQDRTSRLHSDNTDVGQQRREDFVIAKTRTFASVVDDDDDDEAEAAFFRLSFVGCFFDSYRGGCNKCRARRR